MITAKEIQKRLRKKASAKRAAGLLRFFKTGVGEYGEGDKFLGVTVPDIRAAIKDCRNVSPREIQKLLDSSFHEERMVGTFCLANDFVKADPKQRKIIFNFYLKNTGRINNWDLVDLSAPTIVGGYLLSASLKEKKVFFKKLSESKNLWERRIAILATFAFIKKGKFSDTLALAKKYLNDKEDLMHKATGWMLREVGKRSPKTLKNFLEKFANVMPRTMLRYAIEKFSPAERKNFMNK